LLPLKEVKVYRIEQGNGRRKRVRYLIAENIHKARKFLKEKHIKARLRFYKKIKIVAHEHDHIRTNFVKKSFLTNI